MPPKGYCIIAHANCVEGEVLGLTIINGLRSESAHTTGFMDLLVSEEVPTATILV